MGSTNVGLLGMAGAIRSLEHGPPDDLANRFAMSGLNHESTTKVENDVVIDLEVTSNRSDCLGHIGVAREAAVLWAKPLFATCQCNHLQVRQGQRLDSS